MKPKKISYAFMAALTGFVGSWGAQAGPGDGASSVSPGRNKGFFDGAYSDTGSPTPSGSVDNLGQAISGGYYGNTSNAGDDSDAPARGHGVTPSISPGPQTVGGDGPGSGTSLGEAIQNAR
jgi:hypothetical protein